MLLGGIKMPEFKVVVNHKEKSYKVEVKDHHANSLLGKKIGDEVDGIFVSLPGYKLQITGGSDHQGFVMRKDVDGTSRRRLLLSKSVGFSPQKKGMRKRRTVCGNIITEGISLINMKVIKSGAKPIEKLVEATKEKDGQETT